jgi:hypothetical protein
LRVCTASASVQCGAPRWWGVGCGVC